MRKVYNILFALHLFIGIGALFGGSLAIINPQEPLGMTTEALKNGPFENYLIPGIFLFTIIGLGNIISAITLKLKWKFQGYISSVVSWALIILIVIQCLIFELVAVPHVLYFFLGAISAALSMAVLFHQKLFPANYVLKLYKSVRKEL
jgi:hypothetical protein